MLSKEKQREKNIAFWGGFKDVIKNHPSNNGKRINWLKYPTGNKDLFVRLHADGKSCSLSLDIQCKDNGVREVIWEQMEELKVVLLAEMIDEGEWFENYMMPEGFTVSRIRWERLDLDYYKEEDIPLIYAFLKEKITALDRFYQEYKEILLNLLS